VAAALAGAAGYAEPPTKVNGWIFLDYDPNEWAEARFGPEGAPVAISALKKTDEIVVKTFLLLDARPQQRLQLQLLAQSPAEPLCRVVRQAACSRRRSCF